MATRIERRRGPVVAPLIVFLASALLVASAAGHAQTRIVAPLVVLVCIFAVAHERLLAWRSLLGLIILTILFIPIKRYTLPSGLPFNLELYRIIVAVVVAAWLMSLLIDSRISLRRSGLEAPIALYLLAIALSLLANLSRVNGLGSSVVKSVTFFLSFIFVFYLVVSLARKPREIDFLTSVLAGGGVVLGFLGIIESATGYNAFNHLHTVLPFLHLDRGALPGLVRGGRLRVYGSAQHPIAYGAALAILLPLAIYRAQVTRQKRWWLASLIVLMGLLASRSRTGVLMLLAIALVYVIFRPRDMKRFWPAILPALIAIHFAVPGALGTAWGSFFPSQGLVAEQTNAQVGSGRLATLGPALDAEFKPNPVLGEGFGTRITGSPEPGQPPPNAPILDDGWLGILLETGALGALSLSLIFVRSLRRMGRAAKRDGSPRGSLLVATTAAIAAYGLGMFTYDATGFIQVTLLFFIILGIAMAAVLSPQKAWERLT
jgi:O-antigen ligase